MWCTRRVYTWTLLFLNYVNDMLMTVKCNLFLYADNKCLLFQSDTVKDIEKQLNQDFANICDWFVAKKLSIQFGDNKTKSILSASKRKIKGSQVRHYLQQYLNETTLSGYLN